MAKLLRAGIRRYLHSIVFWLAFIATAVIAYVCATEAREFAVDDMYAIIGFVIHTILIVMLVGREYSDSGFRNKVINGHTKGNIFISELILGVGVVLLFCITFFAIFFAITNYIFTVFPIDLILKMFFDCVLAYMSFSAILVTICCLIPNRTIVAIISLLLVFVMVLGSSIILVKLSHPEFSEVYDTTSEQRVDENGKIHYFEQKVEGSERLIENPEYVGGLKRTVFETINNFSPYGHILDYVSFTYSWFNYENSNSWEENGVQHTQTWEDIANQIVTEEISEDDHKNVENNLIYSVILLLGVSAIGFVGFRKKELK